MSDTTITSESTDSGTAVTETPVQTTGTDSGIGEGQTATSDAGGEQSTAEGSQRQSGGRRDSTLYRDVTKLRAQNRELRESLSSVEQLRQDLATLREELNRRNQQTGTAKTPANFWQDPEGTLDSKLDERLERLQNNLFDRFSQSREQEFAQQALRQEQASATEFIRAQKGYDPADDEDLVEIIEAIPNKQYLSPMFVARHAWLELNAQRGIGDRGLQKRQAAGVQGQPPGAGFGRKTWTRAEFDAACDMLEKAPNDPKNAELLKELESAHREGRVK